MASDRWGRHIHAWGWWPMGSASTILTYACYECGLSSGRTKMVTYEAVPDGD